MNYIKFFILFIVVATTTFSASYEDNGNLDVERFADMMNNPSVDRIEFKPATLSWDSLPFVKFPKEMTDNVKTVYFAFGYLEKKWTNFEYSYALIPIRALQNAGWNVVVDGWTTASEAKSYIADPNQVAMYWSSHGTAKGDLTVWHDATHFDYFPPSKISESSKLTRFAVFCSCYSLVNAKEYSSKMNNAEIYGYAGLTTPQTCASVLKSQFIPLFNKHF